jgi:hypothetical protein
VKKLLIKKCSDPQLWYAKLVGQTVELLREDSEGYWSREPAGYTNIVRRKDARVINDEL